MPRRVLIVSPEGDVHSIAVKRAVERRGGEGLIVNNGELPGHCTLTSRPADGSFVLEHDRLGELHSNSISGVWWRRPQRYHAPEAQHPALREFIEEEWRQAFLGAIGASDATFVNPVANSRHAALKALQLRTAAALGLTVPRTLVTSSPREAEQFYRSCSDGCVYKAFTGTRFGFFETRPMSDMDVHELWRVATCPLILQEHVRGDYDLRVTVVGGNVFPARIPLDDARHPVDSRIGHIIPEACWLPSGIKASLRKLVEAFGLVYAAIDLRYSRRRGYTFFELNPEGQYLWTEIEVGLPISNALAAVLLQRPSRRSTTALSILEQAEQRRVTKIPGR